MTPDDLARLKALAERATPGKRVAVVRTGRNPPPPPADMVLIAAVAPGHQIFADHSGGSYPSSDMEFIAACDPSTILALIEAASPVPVPAGEFGERLWALYNIGSSHANECGPGLFVTQKRLAAMRAESAEAIAALTSSHATLLAERDAARAEVERLRAALGNIAMNMAATSPRAPAEVLRDLIAMCAKVARAALEPTP